MVICMGALWFAINSLIGLNQAIDEAKKAVQDLATVQQQTQTSNGITEQSVARTIEINTKIAIEQKAIDDEVERRLNEIRSSYPDSQATRDAATRVQLDSLWDTFCAGNPSGTGCPK